MNLAKSALRAAGVVAAVASLATVAGAATTTTRPAYGCVKVSAVAAPILDKSNKGGSVVATAAKGDVLAKNSRFCGIRGYCSVTYKGTKGWVDKANVKVAACPPSMSKPVN